MFYANSMLLCKSLLFIDEKYTKGTTINVTIGTDVSGKLFTDPKFPWRQTRSNNMRVKLSRMTLHLLQQNIFHILYICQ